MKVRLFWHSFAITSLVYVKMKMYTLWCSVHRSFEKLKLFDHRNRMLKVEQLNVKFVLCLRIMNIHSGTNHISQVNVVTVVFKEDTFMY